MDNLSMIAAVGRNGELGINNNLIWHINGDLKFFKNITLNHIVIMGRLTYESIGRLLPDRVNVIVTSNVNYDVEGAFIMHSKNEVLSFISDTNQECFIIGGSSLYRDYLNLANKIYLTEIDDSKEASVFFPKFDKNLYKRKVLSKNMENNINYKHVLYERK